jgi:hypothetical protein
MISNGQVGAGLFLLATTLFENSPEGQGGRIIFSARRRPVQWLKLWESRGVILGSESRR